MWSPAVGSEEKVLEASQVEAFGDALFDAMKSRRPMAKLSEAHPVMSLRDAYRIQQRFLDRRLQAGDRIIGKKIGLTSKAIQTALEVYQPDFGQLTHDMRYDDGETVDLDGLMQPRAEAELAFVLRRTLKGPGVTPMDVISATDHVRPCFEIVDTRFHDWKIRIQDTVADNASCGVFLLGEGRADPLDVDLSLAGLVIEKNGQLEATGAGAAVQGSPQNAVAWLANTLGELGIALEAGEIILSGAQAPLIQVADGDELHCAIAGVGTCTARFKGRALA
jgi:2-oxopent-4-enoate/cis-2-oxohex-4-enoate hydratase